MLSGRFVKRVLCVLAEYVTLRNWISKLVLSNCSNRKITVVYWAKARLHGLKNVWLVTPPICPRSTKLELIQCRTPEEETFPV